LAGADIVPRRAVSSHGVCPVDLPGELARENLTKPDIAAAIEAAQRSQSARTGITADMVIAELAKIGFANMADYMHPELHPRF
jgi:hypothetical protein